MSKVEFPYATVEYKEPIVYFRVTKPIVFSEEKILAVIAAGRKLCNDRPHMLLTDVRVLAELTPKARKAGASKENTKNLLAQAIVVRWLGTRLAINVFMQVNKPHYPVKVFTNEAKAVKWLLAQKR